MTLVADGAAYSELRRNLSLNPNAAVAGGFTANSVTAHDVGRGACPAGHPQGITTAAWSKVKTGQSPSAVLSMYNIDNTGSAGSTERQVGAWVYVTTNAQDYQARIGSSRGSYVSVPANTWTWVTGPGFNGSNNFAIIDITRSSSTPVAASDIAYVTGVTTLSPDPTVVPSEAIWGGRPASGANSYSWAGAANSSESIESTAVGADRIDPLMVLGPWERVVPLRTEAHQLLDSSEARYSTRPAAAAGGELRMLFATYAAAVDAAGKLASGRVWQMSEPIGVDPTPVTERMMFTGGEVTIEQSANAPGKFVLTAPWSAA